MSQEVRLQAMIAVKQTVRALLEPFYPAVGVQAGWPTNETLPRIGTDTENPDPEQRQVNPLVAIVFGDATYPATTPAISTATKVVPAAPGATTTTTLRALNWETVPLTLAILAAGDQALRIRSQATSVLAAQIGRSRVLLLPDTAEMATNAWQPADSHWGLTATLVQTGRADMDSVDADVRGLRRAHLTYRLTLVYRDEETGALIQSVALDSTIGQTVVPTPPPVPAPLP